MAKPIKRPPILTPKHRVGLERERFYNRILLIITLIIVVVVVGLVSWSSISQFLIFPNQIVAVVEGHEITGKEFQVRARLNRSQLISNYMQYIQIMQLFGSDPNFQQQAYLQLSQIQYQLQPEISGEQAVNQLVDDELLKLEAPKLGTEVSQEEVDQEIQNLFGYYANGSPTPSLEVTDIATSTLSATQLALVSPTPEVTFTAAASATATPGGSLTPTPDLSVTPSNTPAPAETQTSFPSPTSLPVPSATPYTFEGYQKALADYYATQKSALNVTEEDVRYIVYMGLLRQAFTDYITADLPHRQEQVWARHILVATEEEAQAVLDRLAAGEDWTALAAELSTDTATKDFGGDLGWFPKDRMVTPFADSAFSMEIGEVSQPVETTFGWHIIQVLGHEDRPLYSSEYEQLRQQKMQEFTDSLREKYQWEIFDTWKEMAPDEPNIPPDYQLQQQ